MSKSSACFLLFAACAAFSHLGQAVRPGQPASTAEWVCLYRGIAAMHPDPKLRNPDDLAEKLCWWPANFPPNYAGAREVIEKNGIVFAAYFMINVRTHYIDAALKRAAAEGATQVVILGAGFDSRA